MTDLTLYGLIGLGCLILISNFVDFSALFAKAVVNKKPNGPSIFNKESTFLEIVDLWYQLKTKCDSLNLSIASKKLDEVFPLLNTSRAVNNDKTV